MYTLIYPKEDWTAAEIAANLQAFAGSRGVRLNVIPKHYGRNSDRVKSMLKGTTFAIIVAYDKKRFDRATLWEINILKQLNVPIIMILPDNFDFSRVNSILSDYKNNSAVYKFSKKAVPPESIQKFIAENLNDLHRLLKNSKRAGKTTKQSDEKNLLLLLGMLLLLLLMSKGK